MKSDLATAPSSGLMLVCNCGSSSLKYRLMTMPGAEEVAGGEAQRIGPKTAEPSRIVHRCGAEHKTVTVPMHSHAEALEQVCALLTTKHQSRIQSLAHRLVHGGPTFTTAALINPEVLQAIADCSRLAPIHNPPALRLIEACALRFPGRPQVAVFDTAYHSTIPCYARTYTLPPALEKGLGIHKYGFHGTSHHYVAQEAAAFLGIPATQLQAVSAHLGSGGASLCAIVDGCSVDNTFGYSPLQGLVMSTRCGDLDPSLTLGLLARLHGHQAVSDLLQKKSGVLGLSGTSADIRDSLNPRASSPSIADRTALAREIYLWRLRSYLGAYLAVVHHPRAIIFTDTIGELEPAVRWAACSGLEAFGVHLDPTKNMAAHDLPCDVATPSSPVRILVIATNEELAIAREAMALLDEVAEPMASEDYP